MGDNPQMICTYICSYVCNVLCVILDDLHIRATYVVSFLILVFSHGWTNFARGEEKLQAALVGAGMATPTRFFLFMHFCGLARRRSGVFLYKSNTESVAASFGQRKPNRRCALLSQKVSRSLGLGKENLSLLAVFLRNPLATLKYHEEREEAQEEHYKAQAKGQKSTSPFAQKLLSLVKPSVDGDRGAAHQRSGLMGGRRAAAADAMSMLKTTAASTSGGAVPNNSANCGTNGSGGGHHTVETGLLIETIQKMVTMLQVTLGVAGAQIIARNLSLRGKVNVLLPGIKIDAVFGFCDIRNFTTICEALQEDTLVFLNTIAYYVHAAVTVLLLFQFWHCFVSPPNAVTILHPNENLIIQTIFFLYC